MRYARGNMVVLFSFHGIIVEYAVAEVTLYVWADYLGPLLVERYFGYFSH